MAKSKIIIGKILISCIAIIIVVVAMMWLSGVFRSNVIQPEKIALSPQLVASPTADVRKVSLPNQADVVGSIQSELRTTLSARLTANIASISVRSGDKVKKGDVLVVLDSRDTKARVAQANESLRSAVAVRDLAKLETDRLAPMVKQNVASAYELDQWKAKFDAAAADVVRAQQVIREAEVGLSDTQLAAPFDGVVIERQAEPGDMATPGKSLLTIYDPDHLRLEAFLRESYLPQLKLKQEITVTIDSLKQDRVGTVEEIVPAADPGSRSFLVKIHLNDVKGLFPGMFARMRVPLESEEQLTIPSASITRVGQLCFVTVMRNGQPEKRSVRLGHESGDQTIVLAGLNQGETVVLEK